MERRTVLILISIGFAALLLGSMGLYFLFFHDWEPLHPLDISDKDLIETGATKNGRERVVWALNQFAVELYRQITMNSSENIVFSPFSIYLTLCMIYEGTGGETREEMGQVLHLMDNDLERRGSFASIQNDLNDRRGRVDINVANNLWVQKGFPVKEDYRQYVEESYFAGIAEADFGSNTPDAIEEINEWVEDQTNGRIQDLLGPGSLHESTVIAWVNALYFRGDWETQFDRSDTRDRKFITADNRTLQVPTMYLDPEDLKDDTHFRGYYGDGIQAHELPYKGRDLSMVLMLPAPREPYRERMPPDMIHTLERDLSADLLDEMNEGFEESEMSIQVPKFDFETKFSLKEKLNDMGIEKAFMPGSADLSGISDTGSYWIEDGVHQANIRIDEKGTEAAAATAMWEDAGMSMPFQADRPFVFLIQDRETGLILFMGRIMDPSK
ncbi:MAG: serpin family protein [Thermoplasmatota archaeon]